jgi:hypothetical protein
VRKARSERSGQLLREVQRRIDEARRLLDANDAPAAIGEAAQALKVAKSSRAHWPISEARRTLVDALAQGRRESESDDYRLEAKRAFYWAETMPEEIQVWLFDALVPHLERLGLENLRDRARKGSELAEAWLGRGNLNVATRIGRFHLSDVRSAQKIDQRALSLERMAAFYADEMWDPNGELLREAARLWQKAGRSDRSAFLVSLADELSHS